MADINIENIDNIQALSAMVNNEMKGPHSSELCNALIEVLTAHIDISDLLEAMEDSTSLTDVYEATKVYNVEIRRKLDDEEITCESVSKMIREDSALDMARGY